MEQTKQIPAGSPDSIITTHDESLTDVAMIGLLAHHRSCRLAGPGQRLRDGQSSSEWPR